MSIESIDGNSVWFHEGSVDVQILKQLCGRQTDPASVPLADSVVNEIPVYSGAAVRQAAEVQDSAPQRVRAFQQEWAQSLLSGAGVVLIRDAVDDIDMLDQVTEVFNDIILHEAKNQSGADHFAPAGTNTRIWNSHEKLCMEAPELFAQYNANDCMAQICRAWLGPGYQVTAQANIVHPGGRAQHCHRDYHMGFQQAEKLYQYPAHVHTMSPMLTLQGAIAHSDMPVESGPTYLLPFSQTFIPGYLAAANPDCAEYFQQSRVQVPLSKGDMLFFSPALMHAAGDNNTSNIQRFANLVQVSSAYGRAMELLDRARMSIAVYPALKRLKAGEQWHERFTQYVVEASAEGYAFPANMEMEPPLNGLAPESQQQLMAKSLAEGVSISEFAGKVMEQQARKRSH